MNAIACPLYSAPMAGVSDKPFRMMVRRFGNQTLYTEMIGVNTLAYRHSSTCKMIRIADEKNIIVQLVGIDEVHLVRAAQEAAFNGAIGVDINMGCPVKKLITNGSGAALMKNIDEACRLVEKVRANVNIPVSVKTRLGWDSEHINIDDFARRMAEAGVSHLTIHGRTRDQGYSGTADWQTIGHVARVGYVPIVGNGDIVSYESAKKALDMAPVVGLMIGRGLLGKPWLLQEISTGKKPSVCLSDVVLEHFDLLLDYYGKHGVFVARKHLAWYARGKKGVAQFCQNIYHEENVNQIRQQIKTFFASAEDERGTEI